MSEAENHGSEAWEKVDQPETPPNPLDTLPKRSKESSVFIVVNIVLALLVGAAIGFFAFWFTLGPKTDGPKPSETPQASQSSEPSPTPSASPEPAKSENITVDAPRRGAVINTSVTVSGSARVFESALSVRIKNGAGEIIAKQDTATTGEVGQFTPFSVAIEFPKQTLGTQGTVEVYTYRAQSGVEEDLVQVPVIF